MHDLWQAKLAAWIHDPAEKALVLLRDPAGHEGRTVRKLRALLFGSEQLSDALRAIVRRADHWASGADRPEFPRERPRVYWEQTRFTREPILIHPISGTEYNLRDLQKIPHELASEISFEHLERWIVRDADGNIDHRRTLLCLWRFGPEPPSDSLGLLWSLLPADTRLPDHTIWDHLRLCSAFAGAMAADARGEVALLSVSLGPVQSFIAQSRSSSDLWASSHLLSRLSWEAMRVVCERFGPDAIVLPDLRGVPIVDRWLAGELAEIEPVEEAFARMPWRQRTSDANPLFAAALPNRFLAIVPADKVEETAEAIGEAVRAWLHDQARAAFERVLEKAFGSAQGRAEAGFAQIEAQLAGLPELVWSGCDWSLLEVDDRGAVSSTEPLRRALAAFYPPEDADAPGWLGSEARRAIEAAESAKDGGADAPFFYRPRPGVYYGALYELTERGVAAAKATRRFEQRPQQGVRCSLCGEREWLTTDREKLLQVGRGGDGGVWERIVCNGHTFVRKGERLCALCCLKRLWPRLWNDELRSELGDELRRYVVSTHTMALAPTLRSLVRRADELTPADLDKLAEHCDVEERAALPHALVRELEQRDDPELADLVRRLPAQLDALDDDIRAGDADAERQRARLVGALEKCTGTRPEVYYAFVLFDGDRMGALLSGTGEGRRPRYADLWHPKIRDEVRARFAERPEIAALAEASPPPSPASHAAISRALNGFALELAPRVVESLHLGKLLYAGGDDLLAMAAVDDVLSMAELLRCAYSGIKPPEDVSLRGAHLQLGGGHALVGRGDRRRLLRLMGERASGSCGIVIAHYTAPLAVVLRELRAAERRAKEAGGRDAVSIVLIKRAGGTTHWTTRWGLHREAGEDGRRRPSALAIARALRDALRADLTRQTTYHVLQWLEGIEEADGAESLAPSLLRALLVQQFLRHRVSGADEAKLRELADRIVDLVHDGSLRPCGTGPVAQLRALFTVAEFLARESRGSADGKRGSERRRSA